MTIWLVMASMSLTSAAPAAGQPGGPAVPLLRLSFDLDDASGMDEPLTRPVDDDRAGRPLTVSPIDDGRHRLRLGITPGGRAKLGVAYRLSFGN